jgi:hypothetical protein
MLAELIKERGEILRFNSHTPTRNVYELTLFGIGECDHTNAVYLLFRLCKRSMINFNVIIHTHIIFITSVPNFVQQSCLKFKTTCSIKFCKNANVCFDLTRQLKICYYLLVSHK